VVVLKISRYLKPYRMSLGIVVVLIFLQTMANLYLPTLMSDIVDKGIVNGDISYILKIGGLMLAVTVVATLFMVVASFFSSKVAMGFGKDVREKVFKHVESFSLKEFDQVGTASLITRTTNDINQVQQVVMMMMRIMVMAPLMCIGGIIMAVSKDGQLSLVFLVAIPVLVLVIFTVAMKGMPLFKAIQKKLDDINLVLRERLTGVRVIRSFNRIKQEKMRFMNANGDLTGTAIKVNKIMASLMPLMMLIMNLSSIAIVWFGGLCIDQGAMQVGDLMAFIQYAMQIMFSLIMASMMFIMIPRGQASALRINEVLDIIPEINDVPIAKIASDTKGYISFQNVTFSYPGAQEPVLKNVTFEANPGEMTAIIGGTGSGKSTLLNLIPRFYDIDSGVIFVDGIDVREWSQASLREKMGYVPQKAVLFTGSVADNIRFGNECATEEDVQHAAEVAQAHSFITELNENYQSMVLQGGSNLSGGQKQRLSIARAIARKAEIYLFDDSFSALDYKTDALLRQALKKEVADRTVLIVAQRVSTIMDADKIIVLEEGRIAGIGTHQELLAECVVYQEIVASQFNKGVTA
jgi:ATP-binding cassette, subfamily B, multidrug efflux pump